MKYYSEKLDKIFDTQEALTEAEEKHEAEEAKKAEAKALVKKEAAVVNDAFIARNKARHSYNEAMLEARKVYNAEVKAAAEKYNKALEEVSEEKEKAEADFNAKLKEFSQNHEEGYRLTLKDGDEEATYVNAVKYNTDAFDDFDRLFEAVRNLRWPW